MFKFSSYTAHNHYAKKKPGTYKRPAKKNKKNSVVKRNCLFSKRYENPKQLIS
jgi:hypothetical protein